MPATQAALPSAVPMREIELPASKLDPRDASTAVVDIRSISERNTGHIDGSVHIERSSLIEQIQDVVSDRTELIVLYCATGKRSFDAVKALRQLGRSSVVSLKGGYQFWAASGRGGASAGALSEIEIDRYARHLSLPGFGLEKQLALKKSKVTIIGAGGLGCPASLYLAAAGIGALTIVDADQVDLSNLQRQILFRERDVGEAKAECAASTLRAFNSLTQIRSVESHLTRENAIEILAGSNLVLDCTDNFDARYTINESCLALGLPFVSASIFGFVGQIGLYCAPDGPCYACQYPEPPPPELTPNCSENGVLGALPGVLGTLQASEAVKYLTGLTKNPGREVVSMDLLSFRFQKFILGVRKNCVCNDSLTSNAQIGLK